MPPMGLKGKYMELAVCVRTCVCVRVCKTNPAAEWKIVMLLSAVITIQTGQVLLVENATAA